MAPKKSKAGSKIIKRFAKLFGRGCGDFDIVNNDGSDHFLVPIDCDYTKQSLLHWLHYKTTKVPNHFRLTPIFIYEGEEPDAETVQYLNEFVKRYGLEIVYRRATADPSDPAACNRMLVDFALEFGCNKVALAENLDHLNAVILANMAQNARFDGCDVCQHVRPYEDRAEVQLVRPFCYVDDGAVRAFAELKEFANRPTGFAPAEDPLLAVCRESIDMLVDECSNVRMNFFHSQFCVQRKYIGSGDGEALDEDAAMDIVEN